MDRNGPRTRRELLKGSLTLAAVGIMNNTGCQDGSSFGNTAAQSQPPKPAQAWPIACRDAHLAETGEKDAWVAMDAISVEGVEVTVTLEGKCPGLFGREGGYAIATDADLAVLRDDLARHNKKITAFCLHNSFDQRPEEELKCIAMTARAAAALGTPAIRIDVVPHQIKDEEQFLKFSIDMGKRIIETTQDTAVRFGVENHGGTTNKPEFLRRLFGGIGSKRYGSTLDTANFYWFGHPLSKLYEIYEEFAPWVCHTHCKSIKYPESERQKQRPIGWEYGRYCCPIYEGDIDFERIARILRKAGYTGDLCIEDESLGHFPKGQRGQILKREAELLRQVARTI